MFVYRVRLRKISSLERYGERAGLGEPADASQNELLLQQLQPVTLSGFLLAPQYVYIVQWLFPYVLTFFGYAIGFKVSRLLLLSQHRPIEYYSYYSVSANYLN